eukprot:gnl/TRDRNA2_/TRDRNA2_150687_c0_seq1.p1 gnl/TRDRNA2_/TRDRNA2_150687_c0~~gnl/TRDRNA2_/TRDRNA2_150687_c0_seq1.p1  ORF type:complete len:253 (+),score=13.04 gnl/TRDRNA2_/TRDRNA2_150687_c0_seq1:29-760(+)
MYDARQLKLVAHDHVWLSETPRVEGSKSFGSRQPRTLTIAAFQSKLASKADIVMFNTHLDVWHAQARHEQARVMLTHVRDWLASFPDAKAFATGDFNSVNGQLPHRILLEVFDDAWTACKADKACASGSFAATFHGWLGTVVNKYAMRFLQFCLFVLHGSGVTMPTHTPRSIREIAQMVGSIAAQTFHHMSLRGLDMPGSFSRLHVDWILFRNAQPHACFVGDVRDVQFSSDHFPVVAVFDTV